MRKKWVKMISIVLAGAVSISLCACSGSYNSNKKSEEASADVSKDVKLKFQIWDTYQQEGMEDMAKAYHEKHPNVTIEVQTINWDEYWTKLEASANSNSLPDIFWMHTNEFSRYAEAGLLADMTDLYEDVEENHYGKHFEEGLVNNVTYEGKIYGVPKDFDTIALLYNKDIFDEAGVEYPDSTWTWETLKENAGKIYEKTGIYGFLAPLEDQAGYLPSIYQAGGYLINEDKTASGFNEKGTIKGLSEWISWQTDYKWGANQATLTENDYKEIFMSGKAAMCYIGSWMISTYYNDYKDLNWDLAVLPKCDDPVAGDGRATIYNGLSYATPAEGKNVEAAKEFIKFMGSEEGMKIASKSGCAIPAYEGTENAWFDQYQGKNVKVFVDMMEYGVQFPYTKSKAEWHDRVTAELLEVYNGKKTIEAVCEELKIYVDSCIEEE